MNEEVVNAPVTKNPYLGTTGTDNITHFKGTVVGFSQYITGCDQYLLVPTCKEGEESTRPQGEWFDSNRLTFTKSVEEVEIDTTVDKGADIAAPKC